MDWTLEFASDAERDFELIFDHLAESYQTFGESPAEAARRAVTRVLNIRSDADRILTAPLRGESHDDILVGCRHLTIGSASFWFVVDETKFVVTVLAVFFGGQDARRRMLVRLIGNT